MYMNEEIKTEDCPNCGKSEGAIMSSSSWSHDFSCCSRECGKELSKLINKNVNSKEYLKCYLEYSKLKNRIDKLESQLVSGIKKGFKSDPIEFAIHGNNIRTPKSQYVKFNYCEE